ncbi:MAG TPA: hypothetical protein VIN06_00300 [Devosia sp.]
MRTTFFRNVSRGIAAFAAAARAANAVENNRTPRGEDLRTLGIEPAAFRKIEL